jgi:hypothetical protein
MPLSPRRAASLVVVLAALAAGALAMPGTVTGARESGWPAATVQDQDDGPRNPAGEAATGDTQAMLAVVQAIVDCLRSKGFDPGDPEVRGQNVVIADWYPDWDSSAWRADRECFVPPR